MVPSPSFTPSLLSCVRFSTPFILLRSLPKRKTQKNPNLPNWMESPNKRTSHVALSLSSHDGFCAAPSLFHCVLNYWRVCCG